MTERSTLDWSKMCDVGLAVRRRIRSGRSVEISEDEATVLVVAALEYCNRLAHEEGERQCTRQPTNT